MYSGDAAVRPAPATPGDGVRTRRDGIPTPGGGARRLLLLACLALLAAAGGCATTGGGPDGDPGVLTREEIREADLANLYEVVQRLRPRWLRNVRGQRSFNVEGGIVVYQNQTFLGGPEVLRQWQPSAVARMVYLDGVTASNELPGPASNRHVEGAIVIYTRE